MIDGPIERAQLTDRQRRILDRAIVAGAWKWPDKLDFYTKRSKADEEADEPVARDRDEAQMLAKLLKAQLRFLVHDHYAPILQVMGKNIDEKALEASAENMLLQQARERRAAAKAAEPWTVGQREGSATRSIATNERRKRLWANLIQGKEKGKPIPLKDKWSAKNLRPIVDEAGAEWLLSGDKGSWRDQRVGKDGWQQDIRWLKKKFFAGG